MHEYSECLSAEAIRQMEMLRQVSAWQTGAQRGAHLVCAEERERTKGKRQTQRLKRRDGYFADHLVAFLSPSITEAH